MDEKKASFFEHLEALRKVLIISLLAVFIGTVISYTFFREALMMIVYGPLRNLGQDLVMIGVTEGFLVQLKLSLLGGTILGSPVILWQVLTFVWPALYSHERKTFWIAFLSAAVLFFSGIVFAYLFVLELGLKIMLNFSNGLTVMITIGKYLSFLTGFLLPFGLVFEIPLAVYILSRMGIVSAPVLRNKRGYVILAIFIAAAFLSPGGEVISQLLLALPMLFLYEVSILIAVVNGKKKKDKD